MLRAELERRAERVRLGVEAAVPEDGGGTLAALLEWWLDTYSKPTAGHETNRTTIRKHFLGSDLATLSLMAVTAGRIEVFLQAKTAELAPQTINHLRSYLSRAFNAARRAGRWPGPNPTQHVKKRKVPRRQPDYLRPHEVPLCSARSIRAGAPSSRRLSTPGCGRASCWRSGRRTSTSSARC